MTVSVLPETQHPRKIYPDVILGHFVYGFVDSAAKFEICPGYPFLFLVSEVKTIWM